MISAETVKGLDDLMGDDWRIVEWAGDTCVVITAGDAASFALRPADLETYFASVAPGADVADVFVGLVDGLDSINDYRLAVAALERGLELYDLASWRSAGADDEPEPLFFSQTASA